MPTRAPFISPPARTSRSVPLALAAILLLYAGAAAQPAGTEEAPLPFSGRTFEHIVFPVGPQHHNLGLTGDRATVWNDGSTRRLLLDRDASVTIGPYSFRAVRASVWIEPIRIPPAPGAAPVDASQVAVYLEKVLDATMAPGSIPGLEQSGDRLLVTAILIEPKTTLRTEVMEREAAAPSPFQERAERRLATYLAGVTGQLPPPPSVEFELPSRVGMPAPVVGGAGPGAGAGPGGGARVGEPPGLVTGGERAEAPSALSPPETAGGEIPVPFRDTREGMAPAERSPARTPSEGSVSFFADDIRMVGAGEGEEGSGPTLMLFGGVAVQVASARTRETVQLTAERAVVFLDTSAQPGLGRYDVDSVTGIYVEGDVAITNADYHFRGDRAYFDPRTSKAVTLDAVFWTYNADRGMPLYVRADAIRQEASNQWSAQNVTLTNVAFTNPQFSIGARDITITREVDAADQRARTYVEAEGVGFRAGETTLLTIPKVKGEARMSPLHDVQAGHKNNSNFLSTRWDLFALAGVDPPEGNKADLLLDGWFERGPATGMDLSWQRPDMAGTAFGYYIFDNGDDKLTSGATIDHRDDSRGMILGDNIWKLNDKWSLFLEGSYVSDPTFVDAFFEDLAETRREFTNSAYARRLDEKSLFSLEARGTFNDFISNEYLIQSQGYAVEKLPEASYSRIAQELGVLSYTGQASAARMNLVFNEPRLKDIGFNTKRRSQAGFGLDPNQRLSTELRQEGYMESAVTRFDTRHEIEVPLAWGPVNIVPFAVGRYTAWDTDFSDFSNSGNEDNQRFWGSTGVRVATSITRVDDKAESELFDVHRIRHIIEPSATFWVGGTTINEQDLPIYDDDVESIGNGTVFRVGARNTWQTMRGPKHARQSTDWIIWDTNYVWSSSNTPIDSPFGRFIEARPELSNFGEFIQSDLSVLLTDAVTYVGEIIYSFDDHEVSRASTGMRIDHGYGFSTFTEFRYLQNFDSTYLSTGVRYELTRKYAASGAITYDFDRAKFQRVQVGIIRRFAQWTLSVELDLDNVADDVGIGVVLRPVGFAGETRSRIFTYDDEGEVVRDTSPEALSPTRVNFGPFDIQ